MTPWILPLGKAPRRRPSVRVFCFPHAGGGATAFHGFEAHLPEHVSVAAVQLPGRENRLGERPLASVDAIVTGALGALQSAFEEGPFALFGTSFGAVVAFEIARRLRSLGRAAPVRLFVGAQGAPQLASRGPRIHQEPDAAFVRELERLGGTSAEVLENRDFLDMLLGPMRADYTASETYQFASARPLACPITALVGRDDPDVQPGDLDGWSEHTTAGFDVVVFEGAHLFLQQNLRAVAAALASRLPGREVD